MTIYVDVLLVLNMYVDFFLISSCARITKRYIPLFRLILSSAFGSILSLSVFIPNDSIALSIAVSVLSSMLIEIAAFGLSDFVKNTIILYFLSCTYSGIAVLIWYVTGNNGIIINNNIVYFDISPLILIASTVIFYFSACLISKLISRSANEEKCILTLKYDGVKVSLCCLIDTGNQLKDPISDLPVTVISRESANNLLGVEINTEFDGNNYVRGFRLVPCKSVYGSGLLAAFIPDTASVKINNKTLGIRTIVAVSNTDFEHGTEGIIGAYAIDSGEEISNVRIDKKVISKA